VLQQVVMLHFVLLWKFWLVSGHLSFCSGVTCLDTRLVDEVVHWVMTVLQRGGHFVYHIVTVLLVMHSASAAANSSVTGLGLVEWHLLHYTLLLNFYSICTPFAGISTHHTAVLHIIILLLHV
jgi:hypothetical protein